MKKKSFPLAKVYQLIETGPVVMVTTSDKNRPNVMTLAWIMMLEFEPPLIAFVMSEDNYSFAALKKHKECVINVPSVELAQKAVWVGTSTGAKMDKFKQFNLTPKPAQKVEPPLISECYANLECKVIDTTLVKKYNLFIVEVVKAWIATAKKRFRQIHHQGKWEFIVDGKIIKLSSKKK